MDIKEKLFERAVDSILHGSIQKIKKDDGYGNITEEEYRVGDLRTELVSQIANRIANTEEYKTIISKAITDELIEKLQKTVLETFKFDDLPHEMKQRIHRMVDERDLHVKKFKIVVETISDTDDLEDVNKII